MGTLTSWNPLVHSRPVMGLLYLLLPCILSFSVDDSDDDDDDDQNVDDRNFYRLKYVTAVYQYLR